jgi:hypothetical protein
MAVPSSSTSSPSFNLNLPFHSTLSNPTGSSTGSEYSGNEDSYSNLPQQPLQMQQNYGHNVMLSTAGSNNSNTHHHHNHPLHPDLTPINRSGKNLTDKKIRRLEKNRLSARNCRRKKKEYTQSLQREIMMMEGENLRLRLQLQIGQEAEQSSIKEQEKVTEGIDECKWINQSINERMNE